MAEPRSPRRRRPGDRAFSLIVTAVLGLATAAALLAVYYAGLVIGS